VLKLIQKIFVLLTMLTAWGLTAVAEPATRISLLTFAPGGEVYELDGHTALRFCQPGRHDFVVNWGVFDFNAPNFLYRFVKGETDYMAYPFPTDAFVEEYRRQGRSVTEQLLNLTDEQAARLEALVEENLRPENRTYRYNYILDNCATRPLALIEQAVGYPIVTPDVTGFTYGDTGITDQPGDRHTFRGEMTASHHDYPWYQFGIDLALGSGLDREISSRERTYQPIYLMETMRNAYYTDAQGARHQLVSSTKPLVNGIRATLQPTPFWLSPCFCLTIVMLLIGYLCYRDAKRRRISRWIDTLIYSCFFIVSLLLTFLIFVSVHEATSPNWLFLWLNPWCIVPAALIWLKSCKRAVYFYQICNFAALFLLLVIGILRIQVLNPAFYMLILADMMLSARYIYVTRSLRASKTNPTARHGK
jgi:hypothetical protein